MGLVVGYEDTSLCPTYHGTKLLNLPTHLLASKVPSAATRKEECVRVRMRVR